MKKFLIAATVASLGFASTPAFAGYIDGAAVDVDIDNTRNASTDQVATALNASLGNLDDRSSIDVSAVNALNIADVSTSIRQMDVKGNSLLNGADVDIDMDNVSNRFVSQDSLATNLSGGLDDVSAVSVAATNAVNAASAGISITQGGN
jgi:hypothetical protein